MMTMEILKVNIPTLNSNKSKQKNIDNFVPKKVPLKGLIFI